MAVDNAAEIKISRRPDVQQRVESQVTKIQKRHPEVPANAAIAQARDRVASEIIRSRLRKEVESANDRATKDSLTGALNNAGFEDMLNAEGNRIGRSGKSMAIIILDANNLKLINDTKGHEAGNQFLRNIAGVLEETSRLSDVVALSRDAEGKASQKSNVARWGGDEFGVMLTETDVQGAKAWWTRTSKALEAKGITIGAGLQMLSPEDLVKKDPKEIRDIIAKRKSEADLAMMKIAKPQSKQENKPVLVVFNEIPEEIRSTLVA